MRTPSKKIALRRSRNRRLTRVYWVERLEDRHLLSANPLFGEPGITPLGVTPPYNPVTALVDTSGSGSAVEPIDLAQTFFLHSNPSATKTIYLDFDGHTMRETQWNSQYHLPNIIMPAFTLDTDFAFSDTELALIQEIWAQVSEDFAPFNVNVTTQDPGVDALQNTGGDDEEWGVRISIGGSTNDWFTPADGREVGGVAYLSSFSWDQDAPGLVFAADYMGNGHAIAETISHETGHTLGLSHDGQIEFVENDEGELEPMVIEYYEGHGIGATGWAPIMGGGSQSLTQWSKGEYQLANNIEDDLAIITGDNGFDYKVDDHGDSMELATVLEVPGDDTLLEAAGIIERNTDIDYFYFDVNGLGEAVTIDINPFHLSPNLDILAKLYNSSGVEIAMSNPVDALNASFNEYLAAGSYYVTIEGTGRPVFSGGDWGYSDYGSLGNYSITGTHKSLVIGVDFDVVDGTSPENWQTYTGVEEGSFSFLSGFVSERGAGSSVELTVTTTGDSIDSFASTSPISSDNLPDHSQTLEALDGYLATNGETLSFVWSNLLPSTVYEIYIFGHADADVRNQITILGGEWNGSDQVIEFTQDVAPGGLVVNDNAPGQQYLPTLTIPVISNENGEITIHVNDLDDEEIDYMAAIAGLAIAPTQVGSISGRKFDGGSPEDWIIYLDLNDDGELNRIETPDQLVSAVAPEVPQDIVSLTTVKNELNFTEVGEIVDVNITVDIEHSFAADLELVLVSPAGTRVMLMNDHGGTGDNLTGTTFDDSASTSITTVTYQDAPFTGSYRPMEPLSIFNGQSSEGVWTLEITDDANVDDGVLLGWSLDITIAGVTTFLEPNTVTDPSGFYSFDNLVPGLYHVREHITPEQFENGWRQQSAPAPIRLLSDAHVMGANFFNAIPSVTPGSIGGLKWNDVNGDGARDIGEPGLANWVIYVDANNNGLREIASDPVTIAADDLPQPIVDLEATSSEVTFEGLGTVFDVEVTLDITHSFMADLDAFLISPSGTAIQLFSGVGGQFNNFVDMTFDDDAERSIETIGFDDIPYTGTWQPQELLSGFVGEDANGTWRLEVRDSSLADAGTLNSWSLTIRVGELFTTTDASGNYRFDNLPNGQYIVREEQQPGWVQTSTSPQGNSWWDITLGLGQNINNANFGNQASAPALGGDFNGDNKVDAADYLIWRRFDGTQNGYDNWRSNFGTTMEESGGSGALEAATTASPRPAPRLVLQSLKPAHPVADPSTPAAPSDATLASESFVPEAEADAFSFEPASARGAASTSSPLASPTQSPSPTSDAALLAWLQADDRDEALQSDLWTSDDSEPDDALGGFAEIDSVFERLGVGV